ncbi:MAG: hypothetical protein ACH350_08310 [Parachlamydiaceae bacterium]
MICMLGACLKSLTASIREDVGIGKRLGCWVILIHTTQHPTPSPVAKKMNPSLSGFSDAL